MARSIYTMPLVTVDTKRGPILQEKYFSIIQNYPNRSRFDYGSESTSLMGILDVSPTDDATLTGMADVFKLPDNLDQALGAQATAAGNRLEGMNMPGTWVTSTTTYRDLVRFFGAACQFALRFSSFGAGKWFNGTVTLDTRFNQLGAIARQALLDAFDSFGFDRTQMTGTTTLRAIIRSAGQQYLDAGMPLDLVGPL